jgi:hypothetical protein
MLPLGSAMAQKSLATPRSWGKDHQFFQALDPTPSPRMVVDIVIPWLGPGLSTRISPIQGKQGIFLGKIWLKLVLAWPRFDIFGIVLDGDATIIQERVDKENHAAP